MRLNVCLRVPAMGSHSAFAVLGGAVADGVKAVVAAAIVSAVVSACGSGSDVALCAVVAAVVGFATTET